MGCWSRPENSLGILAIKRKSFMMLDPLTAAKAVFKGSLGSIMAHTIRGAKNIFRNANLELDLKIYADTHRTIFRDDSSPSTASVLMSSLSGNRLSAQIFIHRHANKHLARICVAHEVFHLLEEMDRWIKGGRVAWLQIPQSKELEDRCNLFAWELCHYHDRFNRNEALRGSQIFFPEGMFLKPLSTRTDGSYDLPLGVGLDPKKPFTDVPPVEGL